ncbi:MAG TPA: sialidase family protein [Candidatus Sphingobacterium stercoripullorum]|uniref:exo-alpha-sialidase n=1 Tax=Candidatus Sphingobacterium stercoripullorum TaxID=2838759 RepID=A0A9D1W960_9SPHI|nr:glycoside hydrolase [Candidatus Sphingobacterium stercoripullorum]HLR50810.1 sialidase family protein [Candidatus Sphingobacterium stercoripullorum]
MKKMFLLIAFASLYLVMYAQEVDVFKAGEDGYASYRIPAIVKQKDGSLVAFAEGRVAHAGDFGDVDIVYKVSKDNGKTWGKLNVLVDYDELQAGNPAPVVDLLDSRFPNGRLILFYNTGNNHEHEVRKGNGMREVWFITSDDFGKSWSIPKNITTQVHRPNQKDINPDYQFSEDWRAYANTPGHAMQFDSGKFEGRIFVPANHSIGEPKEAGRDYFAHGYFSDDHLESFEIGESVSFEGGNESMAAQISKDGLYMNTRNQQGNTKNRIISVSRDGGATWDTTYYDQNLPDPINQGSVLSWRHGDKYILAVCNAADSVHRNNLTLRISVDKGKTWKNKYSIAVAPEGKEPSFSAYSDLVLIGRKKMGVLYEKDGYSRIVFHTQKIQY